MRRTFLRLLLAATVWGYGPGAETAEALGSAFTYQGRLVDNGTPVNGTCDVRFDLFNAVSSGTMLGTQTKSSQSIVDGTFTVSDLDFGSGPFDGGDRWLEIRVRCPAGLGAFSSPFTPRQRLTAVPYALFAASSSVDGGSIDFSSGNINLANSTNSGNGNILKNNVRFLHNYGAGNTFLGADAGNFTLSGVGNTVIGANALTSNTDGDSNTAVGESALLTNAGGFSNVALGQAALADNTEGFRNTALGTGALSGVTDGLLNIGIGYNAGSGLTTGDKNIYLGATAGASNEAKVMRLGTPGEITSVYFAGIRNSEVNDGGIVGAVNVLIDAFGKVGTVASSREVKRDIDEMGDSTDRLMQLRPVTFLYKGDKTDERQFGLIAEEVEEIFPELVAYGANGKPETIRYHLLSSMLLNELQKQNARLERQARLIDELSARLSALESVAGD